MYLKQNWVSYDPMDRAASRNYVYVCMETSIVKVVHNGRLFLVISPIKLEDYPRKPLLVFHST